MRIGIEARSRQTRTRQAGLAARGGTHGLNPTHAQGDCAGMGCPNPDPAASRAGLGGCCVGLQVAQLALDGSLEFGGCCVVGIQAQGRFQLMEGRAKFVSGRGIVDGIKFGGGGRRVDSLGLHGASRLIAQDDLRVCSGWSGSAQEVDARPRSRVAMVTYHEGVTVGSLRGRGCDRRRRQSVRVGRRAQGIRGRLRSFAFPSSWKVTLVSGDQELRIDRAA